MPFLNRVTHWIEWQWHMTVHCGSQATRGEWKEGEKFMRVPVERVLHVGTESYFSNTTSSGA